MIIVRSAYGTSGNISHCFHSIFCKFPGIAAYKRISDLLLHKYEIPFIQSSFIQICSSNQIYIKFLIRKTITDIRLIINIKIPIKNVKSNFCKKIQTYKKHWLNPKHSQCIWLIFFDMFSALVNDRTDMIICQRIENGFSLSAALN